MDLAVVEAKVGDLANVLPALHNARPALMVHLSEELSALSEEVWLLLKQHANVVTLDGAR